MNAYGLVSSGAKFTLPIPPPNRASIIRAKKLFLERSHYLQSGMERAGSGLRIGQGPMLAWEGVWQPVCDVLLGEEDEETWGRTLCWGVNVQASMKITLWQALGFPLREQINSLEVVAFGGCLFMCFSHRLRMAACSLICFMSRRSCLPLIRKSCVGSSR